MISHHVINRLFQRHQRLQPLRGQGEQYTGHYLLFRLLPKQTRAYIEGYHGAATLQQRRNQDAAIQTAAEQHAHGGIGNARWQGVRLSDVLDMAGVDPAADQVVGRSVDGWTGGFPTDIAFDVTHCSIDEVVRHLIAKL